MKEGWTYKKLGEVCRIERGGSPRPIKDFITQDSNGLNWIKIGDTDPQGKYIYSTKEKIKPEGLRKSRWVEEDEFLLSNSMSFGRPYILKTNGCIHDGWLVLRDYQKNLFIDFFYYMLLSSNVQKQFKSKAQGSTVSNLNTDRVASVSVSFPSIQEQQRIVSRLDAAFAHIDELKANAEKQLSEARALFQKALTKAMEPKEGWTNMKLGEFAYMKAGDFVKASEIFSEYKDGLFPCYGGNGFRGYVRESNQDGDYCMIGRQGALCGCINRAKGIFRTTEHAVIVKPYDNIPTSLVYYMLISLNLNKYSTGAAQPGLSVKNIAEQVIISVPPKEEYNRIVSRLDSLSAHVRELEEVTQKTIAECDALKQALLRKVFE